MHPRLLVFLFITCASTGLGANPTTVELPLWSGEPPGMIQGATPGADDGSGRWRNVGIPGVLVYLPESAPPAGGLWIDQVLPWLHSTFPTRP